MPSMVSSMGSTWMRLPYFTSAHCEAADKAQINIHLCNESSCCRLHTELATRSSFMKTCKDCQGAEACDAHLVHRDNVSQPDA